jgi:hypothetical protein
VEVRVNPAYLRKWRSLHHILSLLRANAAIFTRETIHNAANLKNELRLHCRHQ